MNSQLIYRWIPIVCLLVVVVAGISLKQKNTSLSAKNNALVLQNDSILSVNLRLSKEVTRLQHIADSISLGSNQGATRN